jgi:hypothetical protein
MNLAWFLVMLIAGYEPHGCSAMDGPILRLGRLATGAVASYYIREGMTHGEVARFLGSPPNFAMSFCWSTESYPEYGVVVSYSYDYKSFSGWTVTKVEFCPELVYQSP